MRLPRGAFMLSARDALEVVADGERVAVSRLARWNVAADEWSAETWFVTPQKARVLCRRFVAAAERAAAWKRAAKIVRKGRR